MGVTYIDEIAEAIRKRVPDDLLPDERGIDDLFRLYGLLALSRGMQTTAKDVHDAWAVWMVQRGADHESIRPFAELDADTQDQDRPFVEAIRAACRDAQRD